MASISVMIKPVSGNCNMKCSYCFYGDEQEKRKQKSFGMMTEETLKNVIRKAVLHTDGACFLTFQGGEPSLAGLGFFEKCVQYADHYSRKRVPVHYAFQTNGTDITEEWCEFFRKHRFLVGVSVDGTERIHDRYRKFQNGGATYGKIAQACERMDRCGVEYNILTVVHREVAENIREIYDDYKKKGWNYQQYITCMDPLYEEKGSHPYSLEPEQYGRFLSDLFECWYKDYQDGKQPYIRQFENYIGILMGFLPEACEHQGTCGIQYAVEADGSVYPCDFYMLDYYCLGNLNTDSIAQIDAKREEISFREISKAMPEECQNCPYRRLCRNGCQRNRVLQDDGTYKNYFCEGNKFFFKKHLTQLTKIAREIESKGGNIGL